MWQINVLKYYLTNPLLYMDKVFWTTKVFVLSPPFLIYLLAISGRPTHIRERVYSLWVLYLLETSFTHLFHNLGASIFHSALSSLCMSLQTWYESVEVAERKIKNINSNITIMLTLAISFAGVVYAQQIIILTTQSTAPRWKMLKWLRRKCRATPYRKNQRALCI